MKTKMGAIQQENLDTADYFWQRLKSELSKDNVDKVLIKKLSDELIHLIRLVNIIPKTIL